MMRAKGPHASLVLVSYYNFFYCSTFLGASLPKQPRGRDILLGPYVGVLFVTKLEIMRRWASLFLFALGVAGVAHVYRTATGLSAGETTASRNDTTIDHALKNHTSSSSSSDTNALRIEGTNMPNQDATHSISTLTLNLPKILRATDYAYKREWDAAPVVIESHKLVFFTLPKVGYVIPNTKRDF